MKAIEAISAGRIGMDAGVPCKYDDPLSYKNRVRVIDALFQVG